MKHFPVYWDRFGLNQIHSGIHSYASHLFFELSQMNLSPQIMGAPLDWTSKGFDQGFCPKISWPFFSTQLLAQNVPVSEGAICHGLCNFNLPSRRHHPKLKLVLTVHDLIPFLQRRKSWQYLQLKYLIPRGLSLADRVIVVSEWTLEQIESHFPSSFAANQQKFVVIRNGVPPWRGQDSAAIQKPSGLVRKLLYLARYETYKRLEFTLSILSALPANFELDLVTDAAGSTLIGRLAQDLGLSQRIRVYQSVAEPALQQLYRDADVYIQPSLYEGFCLPVADAMSYGCPIIYTLGSAVTELVGQTVCGQGLNAEASSSDWADAIQTKLADERYQFSHQEAYRRHYLSLSGWKDCAKAVKSLYEQII